MATLQRKYENKIKRDNGNILNSNMICSNLTFVGYPIQKKKSGFYHLFEYKVNGQEIAAFELEFRRDDSVMRYLSVRLDKHAAAWAEKRRERVKSLKK